MSSLNTFAVAVTFALLTPPLPLTIEVKQDVEVTRYLGENAKEIRGKLCVGPTHQGFWIRKGQRFEMTKYLSEGSCRIKFEGTEYDVTSCPWLEGFTDHQTDYYEVNER